MPAPISGDIVSVGRDPAGRSFGIDRTSTVELSGPGFQVDRLHPVHMLAQVHPRVAFGGDAGFDRTDRGLGGPAAVGDAGVATERVSEKPFHVVDRSDRDAGQNTLLQ
ncbi:hypothetical protein [Nocardia gipuzkoensis]|uniref:hypothetical protein n=1 Tax=Nocardia gipuzkoensis TaxID=2749991 RepID=UPI00237DA4EA|nr:hypothetical protein [Nocardia gipuzkoensis]MDE1675017.1 hypothetical protein [Nocardia gipuzkoensis]